MVDFPIEYLRGNATVALVNENALPWHEKQYSGVSGIPQNYGLSRHKRLPQAVALKKMIGGGNLIRVIVSRINEVFCAVN